MNLSSRQVALIAMLVALNVTIGGIVHVTKLPIFLDAIGTALAALLLGLWPAVIVGTLSFVVASVMINPVYIWFIGTQAVIGMYVYWVANQFLAFSSVKRVMIAGLLLGVIAGIVSAPVIVWIFKGVSGSGRDLITAVLLSTGQQIYKAVILSGAASEPIDKLLQMLAAFSILKALPKRILEQFRNPVLERNGLL